MPRPRTHAACPNCPDRHALLPASAFNRDAGRPSGLARLCRACDNARCRDYAQRHPERRRDRALLRDYNLSRAEYAGRLAAQGGGCAICGRPPGLRDLCVDHCHATGRFRGVLCGRCNCAVGLLGDDIATAARLILYLEAHRGPARGSADAQ